MKLRLIFLIVPFVLLAAGDKKAADKPPQSAPAAATALPAGVPAGAVQVGPFSWRHTDAEGKTWIYRKNPFGITRLATGEKPAADLPLPAGLKAVEAGDEVQFERPGPFGVMHWSRKKDQLTDVERKVWERDCRKGEPAAASSGKAAAGEKAAAKE